LNTYNRQQIIVQPTCGVVGSVVRARIWVRHRVRVGSYVLGDETTLSVVC